jgi:hypothetical protein
MTGSNASYQQLGVDAMMSSCFVSGDGSDISADAAAPLFHVPEYTPHGGSGSGFGFVGEPAADVAAASSFSADAGWVLLAGQLLRATALQSVSPEETTHGGAYGVTGGGSYGPSPWDVTVAHAPMMATKQLIVAGEPAEGGWIHESSYYCPTTWFSGDAFRDPPFAGAVAAASELSLRLRAGSSPTTAGAVSVSLPDQSSEVSCSGLTHGSSSAGAGAGPGLFQPPCGAGAGQVARPGAMHFSQVLSRWSGYADIAQQALDEFVACLLQDVAGFAGLAGGGEASCPLPSSSCSKTTSSNPSVFAGFEEHNHKLKNDLQKLLQIVSPNSYFSYAYIRI